MMNQKKTQRNEQEIKTNSGIAGLIVVLILAVPLLVLAACSLLFALLYFIDFGMDDEEVLYVLTATSLIALTILHIMAIYKSIKSVSSYNTSKIISYQNRIKSLIYIKIGLITSVIINVTSIISNNIIDIYKSYSLVNKIIAVSMFVPYIIVIIRINCNKKILFNLIKHNIKSHNNMEK